MQIPLKLNTDGVDTGMQIDALALAIGFSTYNECEENNHSFFSESIRGTFDAIDHEDAFIHALNSAGTDGYSIHDIAHRCDKMPGACFALHFPKQFTEALETWTDNRSEALSDCLGDYSHMPEPYKTVLQKDYEWNTENLYHEWLNGDRSSLGVVGEGGKFFASYDQSVMHYDQKTDTLTLDLEDEAVRDYLQENSGMHPNALEKWLDAHVPDYVRAGDIPDNSELPPIDLMSEALSANLDHAKDQTIEKQKRESAKRQAEWKETQARREASDKADEAERISKLEAMVKK